MLLVRKGAPVFLHQEHSVFRFSVHRSLFAHVAPAPIVVLRLENLRLVLVMHVEQQSLYDSVSFAVAAPERSRHARHAHRTAEPLRERLLRCSCSRTRASCSSCTLRRAEPLRERLFAVDALERALRPRHALRRAEPLREGLFSVDALERALRARHALRRAEPLRGHLLRCSCSRARASCSSAQMRIGMTTPR